MPEYKLTADYHTHTVFSHGLGTAEDNVISAIEGGLREVAISDHCTAHLAYGIRDMRAYLAEIARLKEKYAAVIKVLAGVEMNILSLKGDIDFPAEHAAELDIRLMGYHKLTATRGLASTWHFYAGRIFGESKGFIIKTTDAYIAALASGNVGIVAHPGYGIKIDVRELAAACREYGVLFEINNSHPQLSAAMLEAAAKEAPRFVISSDAHESVKVGSFAKALALAREVGLGEKEIINIKREG